MINKYCRSSENNKKKNNLINKKNCAVNSIKEVELFLHNINKICKSFKIYNYLK